MDKFLVKGPNTLNGTVKIGGAKNAVLPLMTACIIHPGEYILNNVPILRDTMTMAKLLEMVGAKVEIKLEIDADVPGGIDRAKQRTLTENGNTLGFTDNSIK